MRSRIHNPSVSATKGSVNIDVAYEKPEKHAFLPKVASPVSEAILTPHMNVFVTKMRFDAQKDCLCYFGRRAVRVAWRSQKACHLPGIVPPNPNRVKLFSPPIPPTITLLCSLHLRIVAL